MKYLRKIITISLSLIFTCGLIFAAGEIDRDAEKRANEKTWLQWTDHAVTLYTQRKYDEAIDLAGKALDLAEKTFGKDDTRVAESLDNLAIYKQALGRNKEAEEHYKRALAILEARLPPNDHYLAIFMNYLAGFYRKIGKEDEARKLEERASKIRSSTK